LYKSNLVAFVGSDDNLAFPTYNLVIWDDYKKIKIGMIILKEKILNFKLTKNAIFVYIHKKILLFDLLNLDYIYSFDDVEDGVRKFCLSSSTNPTVMAYTGDKNKSVIKIYKCKIILIKVLSGEKGHFDSKFQMMIITTFSEIQFIEISKKVFVI